MIKVLKAGFYTTIQDLGRIGYREYGVPVSGVMDSYSAQLANALLGNGSKDAVLEITLTGPTLQFSCNTSICITGANMNPKLDSFPIQLNRKIVVSKNSILSFSKLDFGCRVYVAISGGFQTELIMNSRSMYSNITSKTRIKANDVLEIIPASENVTKSNSVIKPNKNIFDKMTLGTFKGPEFDMLPKKLQKQLETREFIVSKNNNRMGYQLEERLENNLESILTGPVLPGTVQLTPSGKLIILMRDGQTTGGYPRILQLKEESINVLAQKRAGDFIKFQF